MPISSTSLSSYEYVPETKEDLDWADLPTIDLSKYNDPKGKKELAATLIEAIRTKGFFYVTNFGISQQEVDDQFALGQHFMDLPLEEKLKYHADLENGQFNGYRPAGTRLVGGGLKDRVEVYNIPKFNGLNDRQHPAIIERNLPQVKDFARKLHDKILDPLHNLISIALGLPEDFFANLHKYENASEDHLRYMKYGAFSEPELKQMGNGMYNLGHTDLGTLTLLFRQPIAALQIKDHVTGDWKWAKPLNASLTVNTCDALSFLTGNYIKSTVHRVCVPPPDQRAYDRLGLLYFARPQNDLVLQTIESPVLREAGYTQNEFEREGFPCPTMGDFVTLKQKWQQQAKGGYKERDGETIVPGFKGRYHD